MKAVEPPFLVGTSADRSEHSAAAASDCRGTGESDHRDQSSRSVGEGEKRGEIFVAKTAGEQSSGQCVRRWRAIPRREVFHGIDRQTDPLAQ